ncbi:MAG: histidine phosphatase family protein [Lachnospiraceae bacterium]|nr:histidine phosphatase family protein [Lachnospiraceae bacterium]
MIIYLMRHGETDWNKRGCFQGQMDVPLNDYGRELAEITAEALKDVQFEAAFCSPLIRAVETANIMLKGQRTAEQPQRCEKQISQEKPKVPLITDERLKEINFGIKEGSNIAQMRSDPTEPLYYLLNDPKNYVPPEGAESLEEVYKRSASFMEEKIRPLEKQYETILIVAHGVMNRSIINPIAGIPMEDFWSVKMLNCTVAVLSLQDGKFQVVEKGRTYYE